MSDVLIYLLYVSYVNVFVLAAHTFLVMPDKVPIFLCDATQQIQS